VPVYGVGSHDGLQYYVMQFIQGLGLDQVLEELKRLNLEIERRTRVVGTFPDGESALMLVAARLRHAAGTKWGTRRYLSMDKLRAAERKGELVAPMS
jgi:hypothetical protein